jgi:hypothetical protein
MSGYTGAWPTTRRGDDRVAELAKSKIVEPPARRLDDPDRPWLRTVLREIRVLSDLDDNWDGYGAGPIRADVLDYTLGLLQSVMEDFPAPQLTPMSHEGVLLEWHRDGVRLEIEIENAGEAYVSYENEENGTDRSWEVKADFNSLFGPLRAIAGQTAASHA